MKKNICIFILGFLICCYPLAAGIITGIRQQNAVATFQESLENNKNEMKESIKKAESYNQKIANGLFPDDYNEQLNLNDTGIMGSIEIPNIKVNMPIYHGTSEEVLSAGAGHLEGTSLPIGGMNTHSVITGHRGLPSSKLFVRLDEMKKGDIFLLRIYGKVLAYKVCEIKVVKADNTTSTDIEEGKDLVSLVTCTPYGINSHRLIVTGSRIEYKQSDIDKIESEIPSIREIIFTYMPFAILALFLLKVYRKKQLKKNSKRNNIDYVDQDV